MHQRRRCRPERVALGAVCARVGGDDVVWFEYVGNQARARIGGAYCELRRIVRGRRGQGRTTVGEIGPVDVGPQDGVLEATLPSDLVGVGSAVEAIDELGQANVGQGDFDATVFDHVVDVEAILDAVWVAMVLPDAHPCLVDDRLGQQFDLRVVQGRQAGPCLLVVEGSQAAIVIVHRVGSSGSRETGVLVGAR